MKAIITGLVFICAAFAVSDALTCYSCSWSKLSGVETGNTNCKEPSSSSGTSTLSAVGITSCSSCKTRTVSQDPYYLVERLCVTSCSESSDTQTAGGKTYTTKVKCCSSDRCNSAKFSSGITARLAASAACVVLFSAMFNLL